MTAKRLLLILALLALFAASGVVWAAATLTTGTVLQIPFGYSDLGTTWTAGGMTHVRGAVADTVCLWDYDDDGIPDAVTTVVLTVNTDRDADGAGTGWGTWSEYDYPAGTELLGGGTWQAKYTCSEFLGGEEYAYGWVDPVGWRWGPNGDWAQMTGTLVLYSQGIPEFPYYYVEFRGEARFLVPGGP